MDGTSMHDVLQFIQTIAILAAGIAMVWKVGQFVGRFEVRLAAVEEMLKMYLMKVDDTLERIARLEGANAPNGNWPRPPFGTG